MSDEKRLDVARAIDIGNRLNAVFGERDEWGTWTDLLRSLNEAGLHLVTEADKRVLEAWRDVPDNELAHLVFLKSIAAKPAAAELVRRTP